MLTTGFRLTEASKNNMDQRFENLLDKNVLYNTQYTPVHFIRETPKRPFFCNAMGKNLSVFSKPVTTSKVPSFETFTDDLRKTKKKLHLKNVNLA